MFHGALSSYFAGCNRLAFFAGKKVKPGELTEYVAILLFLTECLQNKVTLECVPKKNGHIFEIVLVRPSSFRVTQGAPREGEQA
jgi:hypothetical protein